MKKPELNEVSLSKAFQPATVTVTMSQGQWDTLLQVSYDQGFVLVELDRNEIPVRAYRKQMDS